MINDYVLTIEFRSIPEHAVIFKRMVESDIDNLIATNGLKGKGPVELQNASAKEVAENSASDNTGMLKCNFFLKRRDRGSDCPLNNSCGDLPCLIAQQHA